MAVDPSGKFVYVANASPTDSISAFTVDPNTGALSRVVGSPFSTPGCDASITVDPSAKFVYKAERCGQTNSDNVLGFSLDPSTGALKSLDSSPFASGGDASSIVFSRATP